MSVIALVGQVAWTVWSGLVGVEAFLLSIALSPVFAIARVARHVQTDIARSDIWNQYRLTRDEMRVTAKRAVDLVSLGLDKQTEIEARFYHGHYQSLEEAQIALALMRLAERKLLADMSEWAAAATNEVNTKQAGTEPLQTVVQELKS